MEHGAGGGLHSPVLGGVTPSALADLIRSPDANRVASSPTYMNNRFFLALVLTAIVIIATPLLFPGSTKRLPDSMRRDSTVRRADSVLSQRTMVATVPGVSSKHVLPQPQQATISAETTSFRTSYSTYTFSARGATPVSVVLDSFPSHRKGIGARSVELVGTRRALTSYQLVLGQDTVALDTVSMRMERIEAGGPGVAFTADISGHFVRMAYVFPQDTAESYLVHVTASIASAPPGSALLVGLPQTLLANEADTVDDLNHLAVSYRPFRGAVNSIAFSKLDSAEVHVESGPINWVATRNKYFLVAYRTEKTPFSALHLQGAPRQGKIADQMYGSITLPLKADGTATFEIYAGPQNFERLQHLGGDLDQVNPYAGFLHGVVQPFATGVMRALLWMKRTTQLNYGWVLVLFGVIVRLILWPLNQGAMRTSMKMQRLQPELQALQKKHTDDPKKQQEAIMKVYKEHGMSPLSPLMGCLPMLLPMPVLFALYYVFQNTIEFRGVSFLWLPDISLRDPYYITPLLMGVSMFAMSWIGMRNAPPNPQAKMMTYMMPVMLTVLFLNFASGLNLYYAVQNDAAIPQQWLLARERARATPLIKSRGRNGNEDQQSAVS